MNMLLDLLSQLQATEDQIRDKAATDTVSPSTFSADQSRTWARHQQFPQVPDLTEAIRERVAKMVKQLHVPFIVAMTTAEGSSLEEKPAPR